MKNEFVLSPGARAAVFPDIPIVSDKYGAVANYNFEKPAEESASQGRGISVSCLRK